MAGDWIKMRCNLWDDPRVAKLCDLTGQSEAAIVGGLYWLWATADQHSENGIMPGLTVRSIDRKTGISGFGDALVSIGWLADHSEGVRVCHFEEHNGASAKARLMTAKRVANHKANGQVTVAPLVDSPEVVSDALPRIRIREEVKTNEAFASFWSAYPKKKNKGQAEKVFAKLRPDSDLLQTILNAVEGAASGADWLKSGGQFIPYPATWLAAKGWEDGNGEGGAKPWEQ